MSASSTAAPLGGALGNASDALAWAPGNGSAAGSSALAEFNAHQLNMLAILCVTMGLALVGNGFLFFVIVRTRKRSRGGHLSPVHILILHSCANDVLFALLTLLPQVLRMLTFPRFRGGPVMCPLLMFLNVIPMYGSSFLLVAISADRYTAVCRPLASLSSSKTQRAHVLAGLGWAAALLLSAPQLAIFRLQSGPQGDFCASVYAAAWMGRAYILLFTLLAWLLPSLASAALYTAVCRQVWRSLASSDAPVSQGRLATKALTHSLLNGDPTPLRPTGSQRGSAALGSNRGSGRSAATQPTAPSDARKHQSASSSSQRAKTVKLTLTIVVCNFVLYGPFCISNVIYAYIPEHLDPVAIMYIMLIGNLNSCVNPWIYLLFNFRQARDSLKAFSRRERNRSAAAAFSANFPLASSSPRWSHLNGPSGRPAAPSSRNPSSATTDRTSPQPTRRRPPLNRTLTGNSLPTQHPPPPAQHSYESPLCLRPSATASHSQSTALLSPPQSLAADLDDSFVTCFDESEV